MDCAGIAAGTASKADNRVAYLVDFDLVVDNDFSFDVVAEAVRQILQQQVAPLVAGCVGRRRMQETSSTGIKNVLFLHQSKVQLVSVCRMVLFLSFYVLGSI